MNWWAKIWILVALDVATIGWVFWRVRRDDKADAVRRREYRLIVVELLTLGVEATRLATYFGKAAPVLTVAEEDEMDDARQGGVPAKAFALRLRARDRQHWMTAG